MKNFKSCYLQTSQGLITEKAMATHSSILFWKIPWREAAVHGVSKSRTRLSDFTLTFHFHALEKEMATHSSVLAWRIPGTGSLVGCCLWVAQGPTRLKRLSSSSSRKVTTERLWVFGHVCLGRGLRC